MFNFWDKIRKKISPLLPGEIAEYKDACEQLIYKYEHLLQQISDYMSNNHDVLAINEQKIKPPPDDSDKFHLNSFLFLSIKKELSQITQECDSLLEQGTHRLVTVQDPGKAMNILISQLKELRTYSDQIEEALLDFEEKLMEMEELVASRSLHN